ncbi:MAG: hypothetical protein ACK4SY_05445 [Pyrobaculum sp.]
MWGSEVDWNRRGGADVGVYAFRKWWRKGTARQDSCLADLTAW